MTHALEAAHEHAPAASQVSPLADVASALLSTCARGVLCIGCGIAPCSKCHRELCRIAVSDGVCPRCARDAGPTRFSGGAHAPVLVRDIDAPWGSVERIFAERRS